MHSRIFEILPVDYKDDGRQNEVPDWWQEEHADYVRELVDKEEHADYVRELADKEEIDDSFRYFLFTEIVKNGTVTFTKNYLKNSWVKFKETLDKIAESATEEQFMTNNVGDLSWKLYKLQDFYDTQNGVWFMDEAGAMYTLSDMERTGGTYKLGRV